jgi:hypothetical protein
VSGSYSGMVSLMALSECKLLCEFRSMVAVRYVLIVVQVSRASWTHTHTHTHIYIYVIYDARNHEPKINVWCLLIYSIVTLRSSHGA